MSSWNLSTTVAAWLLVTAWIPVIAADSATNAAGASKPEAISADTDRSPVDLVLGPHDDWLATANQTSDSVSLVGTADGQIWDEVPVGRRPVAIARCPDGQRIVVSCSYANQLVLLKVADRQLKLLKTISVVGDPHGVAVAPDGRTAYVALAASGQIAVVDLDSAQVTDRIDVGRWPRYVALSPDGTRLAVGTSGDLGVAVIDTTSRQLSHLEQFAGLNIGHLQTTSDGQHVYFPWIVYRRTPVTESNIRRGWVLASRLARVRTDGPARREALPLDTQGKAVADPHGLALTHDQEHLLVTASGTHELLIFRSQGLPLKAYGESDHIDSGLLRDRERFARVPLGGRPMGVRIDREDRLAYVANYLDNSVQVVDLEHRELSRTISLGGSQTPSLARRGAAIFYDGRRSLDQWYSCHSCHYEGGTNSVVMDTENDGSSFTFKTVLPLYNLPQTAPWTWHGWQQDLTAAMHKSMTSTMLGPEPDEEDVQALIAFFGSLAAPPNAFRSSGNQPDDAVRRGEQLFVGARAECASCHSGPLFTDGEIHDIGLSKPSDQYQGFNTPSLLGVANKVLFLHDGRCKSLEELLRGPHSPNKVNGLEDFSEAELEDVIAYLKTL